jgi:hypothetical protein
VTSIGIQDKAKRKYMRIHIPVSVVYMYVIADVSSGCADESQRIAVTHRELLKAVWGNEYGDEREYLRVFISQLRHKIEINPMHPAFILTEPGVGYRFASDSF